MEDTTQKYGSIPLDTIYAIRDDKGMSLNERIKLIKNLSESTKQDIDKVIHSMVEGYLYCPYCKDYFMRYNYIVSASNKLMYDYNDDNMFEWVYSICCPHGHTQEINEDLYNQLIEERKEYNFKVRGIK